jgi:hypothetical protein
MAARVVVLSVVCEHDPVAGEEAAVEEARVVCGPPPRLAHRAEADVLAQVDAEEAAGDLRRKVPWKLGPVPPASVDASLSLGDK